MADEEFKGAGFRPKLLTKNPPFFHWSDLPRGDADSQREASLPDVDGSRRRNDLQKPDRHCGLRPPKPRGDRGVTAKIVCETAGSKEKLICPSSIPCESVMATFPLWIRHGGTFGPNLQYVGGKLVGKMTKSEMGYEMFKDLISSFLKIDCKKVGVDMKFNPDMQEMSDWYDIVDDDNLLIFLCYASENPKKYHLFVSVYAKAEGHSSFRSSKESVKDNQSTKFGDDYLEFFGYEEVKGTDSFEEDRSGGSLFDDDFATQCEELDDWASLPSRNDPNSGPRHIKEENVEEQSGCPVNDLHSPPAKTPDDPPRTSSDCKPSGAVPKLNPFTGPAPSDSNDAPFGGTAGRTGQSTVGSNDPIRREDDGNLFDVEVADVFNSKQEFQKRLHLMMIRTRYEFKVHKSSPSLLVVRCMDNKCSWRVRGTRVLNTGCWMVTKFVKEHTCAVDYTREGHRQATSWVIGDCLKNRYIAPSRTFKPKDIVDDVRDRFEVQITYNKAWRAREVAYDTLRGTPEEAYTFLPSFLHVLVECNPGTTTDLVLTQEGRFNYLFFALAASKEGYKFCRPVVCVDGAHLKGKYKRLMLTAVCKDGNNSIFPLAWRICDAENDSSWWWFFTKFKQVYGDRPGLVIVSDRHPSIAKAIREIYPGAFYAICMQHLLHNIKNKFRGISVDVLYYRCAKAYRLCEFACLMNALMLVQPQLGPYLQEVGYERWSRAYSEGRRYNIMTTNISECINAILVKERELPVTALAEEMRSLVQRWHYERRTEADKCKTKLTPSAETLLAEQYQLSTQMRLDPASDTVYTVLDGDKNGLVDLQAMTCSCRRFQLEQLPCAHAMLAIRHSKRDVYDFCSQYYNSSTWKVTYAGVVYPLPHQGEWVVPNEVRAVKVLPPDIRSVSGRRRKSRIPSVGETAQRHKYSRCCQMGHHRKTCQNPIPLHETQPSNSSHL